MTTKAVLSRILRFTVITLTAVSLAAGSLPAAETPNIATPFSQPEEYLCSQYVANNVVCLESWVCLEQQSDFLTGLLPWLHDRGVHLIAAEFLRVDVQDELDSLILGPTFCDTVAVDLLMRQRSYDQCLGHLDFMRSVWSWNRDLADEERPMRLLAVGASEAEFEAYQVGADLIGHYADQAERILVLPLARFETIPGQGLTASLQVVLECPPLVLFTHLPWPARSGGLTKPPDGALDSLINLSSRGIGFDIDNAEYVKLSVLNSVYDVDTAAQSLANLCDGYIILNPLADYRVTECVASLPEANDGIAEATPSSVAPKSGEWEPVRIVSGECVDHWNRIREILQQL